MKEKLNFYTKHRATPCNTKDVDLSVVETEMFPDAVYVGDLVSLSGESVPALLPLEEMGGLCFLSTPDNAQQVLHCMENIAFRLLLDLPPRLCNLILYDGTGQGSHLIDLLGLSSRITGGNIMTEPEELRRTLAQMKSEIPNVVQKVLGYRYQGKTLADYNREAGELARPYQLLIIADFPHTLTAEMCESIEQLLQNGRQAGIFIMLNVDGTYVPTQQKDYDVHPLFQKMVTIYQSPTSGDWYVKNSPLESWVNKGFYFHLAEPFAKETLDAILNDINMRLARQKKAEVSLLNMLTPANLWKRDASEGVEIPIGMVNSSEVQYFVLGHSDGTSDVPHHCLVGGATGSGKTVLLHDIICNGAWFYSPEALQFVLLDYKEGTEFKVYEHLPHVRVLSMRSEQEFGISVLNYLDKEIKRRGDLFKAFDVSNLSKYNAKAKQPLPRILVVIDEFQKMLVGTKGVRVADALDDIGRRGRSFGINLILSTQSLSGLNISPLLSHLGLRITLKLNSAKDCDSLLGVGNHVPFTAITKVGEGIYNPRSGLMEGNRRFQCAYMSDTKLNYIVHQMEGEAQVRYGTDGIGKRFIYDGEVDAHISDNPALKSGILPVNKSYCEVYVGEPVTLVNVHTSYRLQQKNGSNVLMVGTDTTAAVSVLYHSVRQFMAQDASAQCFICDKTSADSEWYGKLQQLASLSSVSYNQNDQAIEGVVHQLKELLAARLKGEEAQSRVLLVMSDPYSVRSMRKSGYNPSPVTKELLEVLRDGPACGIHVMLYFSSYTAFSSILDPLGALPEFDIRIGLLGGDSHKIFGAAGLEPDKTNLTRRNLAVISSSSEEAQLQKFKVYTL